MKTRSHWILALVALTTGLSGAALWISNADAEGIPSPPALHYAGTLFENGQAFDGSKNVKVAFFAAEVGGGPACEPVDRPVTVSAGRFRVALPEGCVAAVRAHRDLWVEVAVEGKPLQRRKLGAVPYAVEAGRASEAAGDLQARLAALEAKVSDLGGQLAQVQALAAHPTATVGGKRFSIGGYCGATAAQDGAAVGGYGAAKSACEAACGTPSAHLCSGEELVRSRAAGVGLPAVGWYATGTFVYDSVNANAFVDDCHSYTSSSSGVRGAAWTSDTDSKGPNWYACDRSWPLLCCD